MGRPFLCSMHQREGYVSPCGARTASGGPLFPCGAKPDGCYGGIAAVAALCLHSVIGQKYLVPEGTKLPKPPISQKFLLVIRGKVWYTAP